MTNTINVHALSRPALLVLQQRFAGYIARHQAGRFIGLPGSDEAFLQSRDHLRMVCVELEMRPEGIGR